MMNYVGYEEYISQFDSDDNSDDDTDPVIDPIIKQLKHNAYFEEDEEPGWVIVLPGFKPYRYNIKPVADRLAKKKVVKDNGLKHHNAIVNMMKKMALKMKENVPSNDNIPTPPIKNVPKQNGPRPEVNKHNEPHDHNHGRKVEDPRNPTHNKRKNNRVRRKNNTNKQTDN